MDDKARRAFITANLDLIPSYEIARLYRKVIRERIREQYGIFVGEEEIKDSQSFEENWKRLEAEKIEGKYTDIEQYKLRQAFDFTANNIRRVENGNTIIGAGLTLTGLLYLLRYVVEGVADPDLAIVNEMKDKSGLPYDVGSFAFRTFEGLNGIEVKKQANGKVIVKGMTEDQQWRLAYIVELINR